MLAVFASCAGARPGPTDAVASYAAALRDARYEDAYRLLSAETRRLLSYEDFSRVARESPDEVRETLRWLDRVDPRAPVTARLELQGGEPLMLVEEGGQWRLDPSALEFYGQRTPRQTLRSFARALQNRRWDVLLRFAPRRIAEGLNAEQLRAAWDRGSEAEQVQAMLTQLQIALDANREPEVSGDRATPQYGPGSRYLAQLVREDGVWKVENPG